MRCHLRAAGGASVALLALALASGSAFAGCYDILGCTNKNDFSRHYNDYLASSKSGPNCEFLWTMRNEIYAEHGYCFQTQRGRDAFGNANCRHTDQSKVPLNSIERANIATIARAERAKSCPP